MKLIYYVEEAIIDEVISRMDDEKLLCQEIRNGMVDGMRHNMNRIWRDFLIELRPKDFDADEINLVETLSDFVDVVEEMAKMVRAKHDPDYHFSAGEFTH